MTAAWRALQLGVLAASFASPAKGPPAVSPVTPRIIEEPLQIAQPIGPCDLPAIVWRVARSVRIPAGIEALPGHVVASLLDGVPTSTRSSRG